jgi:hypothetical protein
MMMMVVLEFHFKNISLEPEAIACRIYIESSGQVNTDEAGDQ